MYDTIIASVLWYISWPVLLIVAYFLVRWGLRTFEKRQAKEPKQGQ